MLANNWDIKPGDWAEVNDGTRGMVTSTCTMWDILFCVEVGFKWVSVDDLISWTSEN